MFQVVFSYYSTTTITSYQTTTEHDTLDDDVERNADYLATYFQPWSRAELYDVMVEVILDVSLV